MACDRIRVHASWLPLLWLLACGSSKDTGRSAPQPAAVTVEQPAELTETAEQPAQADYEGRVAEIRQRLARKASDSSFHIVIEPPFIVIGDESPQMVRRRSRSTVRWAVDRLKAAYFSRDPAHILEVWLFAGERSYRAHTLALFGDRPDTPFGYYSPRHGALIMNIATGGGTLVHEIVHPFIESNFPDCPAWFNEGLGSLYEQSGERDGEIIGYTNWRLEGLQSALRAGEVPSFETLTATTTDEFYEDDPGTNYAQARYLLYYLQESGLLRDYYARFVRDHATDPTGYKTLRAVLGVTDMDAFFRTWKAYVLGLTFP